MNQREETEKEHYILRTVKKKFKQVIHNSQIHKKGI